MRGNSLVSTTFLVVLIACTAFPSDSQASRAGRHRIDLIGGMGDTGTPSPIRPECVPRLQTDLDDILVGLAYGRWLDEKLSANVTVRGLVAEARATTGPANDCETALVVSSLTIGVRYYPLATERSALLPYVTAAVGPYIGVATTWEAPDEEDYDNTTVEASFGGYLGAGLDIAMGRLVMIGIWVGGDLVADFPEPLNGRSNLSGVTYGISVGFLFGSGR